MSPLNTHRIIGFRGLGYFLVVVFYSLTANHFVLEGSAYSISDFLLVLSVVTLGQALMVFFPQNISALLALFLCDAALAMTLVRMTGASASPFLVLFPSLSILASIVFPPAMTGIFLGACLLFSGLALNWGLGILGQWTAILAVGVLGLYLMKLLRTSDRALQRSELARMRLENLQKVILANIPSGLLSVDSDGSIIQVNSVGQRILGHLEQEVLGKSLSSVLPGLKEDNAESNTRSLADYMHPSGRILKLGYSMARLEDPSDKKILGNLLTFQDLTEIMKLEEDLRVSEKLAAVGKLAAGIAHEIRNPLAGISGSAQLLEGAAGLGDEDRHLLKIIQRESQRLDGLITEFLEYVKPQKLELKAVNLTHVLVDTLASLEVNPKWKLLSTQVNCCFDQSVEVWVSGDANKLTQVLLNLFLNAGQAGAKKIRIDWSSDRRLSVFDDGSGIGAENISRIFEPFFTTKEKGTGLGLAVSYKVLEAMGAKITVRSPIPEFCEKGGTLFMIDFQEFK